MPTYKLFNTKTKKVIEVSIRMSEYDNYKVQNPHLEPIIQAPALVSMVGGMKTDDTFKEVLSKVAEAHPDSPVAQKHGRKSISQTRTKTILEKHRKRRVRK